MKNITKFLQATVIFCFISAYAFSQDIIVLKTGDEILSKVEEIAIDAIKYRKFENLSGPLYTIEKSKVFMIKYQNGTKDVFNEQPQSIPEKTVVSPKALTQQAAPAQQVAPSDFKTLVGRKDAIWYNGQKISDSQVKTYMAVAPGAYEMYKKGSNQYFWGDELFLVSLICDLGMIIQYNNKGYAHPLLQLASVGTLGSGIALMIVGNSNVKRSVRLYNSKATNPTSFNFNLSPTGLGISMKF